MRTRERDNLISAAQSARGFLRGDTSSTEVGRRAEAIIRAHYRGVGIPDDQARAFARAVRSSGIMDRDPSLVPLLAAFDESKVKRDGGKFSTNQGAGGIQDDSVARPVSGPAQDGFTESTNESEANPNADPTYRKVIDSMGGSRALPQMWREAVRGTSDDGVKDMHRWMLTQEGLNQAPPGFATELNNAALALREKNNPGGGAAEAPGGEDRTADDRAGGHREDLATLMSDPKPDSPNWRMLVRNKIDAIDHEEKGGGKFKR